MKIRRIIIYNKKKVKYSMLLEEVKRCIKTHPIFIGTPRQWNKFVEDFEIKKQGDKLK